MTKRIIAVLLGRKGSKGIKDKNLMTIFGRYALDYPILAALNSKYIEKMYISSDDERIFQRAISYGFERIDRPKKLCTDEALFEDALEHAYFEVKKRMGNAPEIIVALMCNAVTVNSELIDRAIKQLKDNKDADSAVTVTRFNMYSPLRARKLNDEGYLQPFVPFDSYGDTTKLSCDRNSQGDCFFADMSHSVVRSRCLENLKEGMLPQRWMGQKILPVYNNMGCDIDEPWQLDMSIRWLKMHGFSKNSTPYSLKNSQRMY
jgi:CMP-N-acetylneuraminic acid synthetase